MTFTWRSAFLFVLAVATVHSAYGQPDGFLTKDGSRLYPLGFYELPGDDAGLKAMAASGVNLVRCNDRAGLDRAQAVGLLGWLPLDFAGGPTDAFRAQVESVVDHPALAVWEGPDEIVWNFTAYSGLFKTMGVHKKKGEWWDQTPEAVAYADQKANEIIPKMHEAVDFIRGVDRQKRPVWINEAQRSDMQYVRRYLEYVDITGCDAYPVKADERPIARMGIVTDRWVQVGKGKPVWMVLQAFSWHELGDGSDQTQPGYATFAESRFMAYDCIAHGARGLLYWGSQYTKNEPFRASVYAVTRELGALQPFLVAPDAPGTQLTALTEFNETASPKVSYFVRKAGSDWLVVFVNEDDVAHMGVAVDGLDELNGRPLHRLYDAETQTVARGELVTRLMPREVRVYCTDRRYETQDLSGRDFAG